LKDLTPDEIYYEPEKSPESLLENVVYEPVKLEQEIFDRIIKED